MSPPRTRWALVLLLGLASCRSSRGEYIWVHAVPQGMLQKDTAAVISPGDVIGVRVFGQEANSIERARVREDGKISIPFLNDVEVAGLVPSELARRLEAKLAPFIVKPVVTVVMHEHPPLRVSVLGHVARAGVFDLDEGAGVIHAIAAAGGVTAFAADDGVYVLRSGYWADAPTVPARIRLRWTDVQSGKAPASRFRLRRGDVVVVE